MQIDSTPLDVLVRLDDGIAEKVELTAMSTDNLNVRGWELLPLECVQVRSGERE